MEMENSKVVRTDDDDGPPLPPRKPEFTTFCALAFELSMFHNPVCKKVVCIVGGLMMFFDALQPHRIIAGRKPDRIETSGLGVGIGTSTKAIRASINDVSSFEVGSQILGSAKGPELSQIADRIG